MAGLAGPFVKVADVLVGERVAMRIDADLKPLEGGADGHHADTHACAHASGVWVSTPRCAACVLLASTVACPLTAEDQHGAG